MLSVIPATFPFYRLSYKQFLHSLFVAAPILPYFHGSDFFNF